VRSPRHKRVDMFAIIDNPTIVDRPKPATFPGSYVSVACRGHSAAAAPPRPAARRTNRPVVARTRRVGVYPAGSPEGAKACGPIIKTAKHLQSAERPRTSAVGKAGRYRASLRSTTRADHLGCLRCRVRVRRGAAGVRPTEWWCVEPFYVRAASPGTSGTGGQKIGTG
jgi:hypothetical protein